MGMQVRVQAARKARGLLPNSARKARLKLETVAEAAVEGYIEDAGALVTQADGGVAQAGAQQILTRRGAGEVLETAQEMPWAKAGVGSHVAEGEGRVRLRFNGTQDAGDARAGRRGVRSLAPREEAFLKACGAIDELEGDFLKGSRVGAGAKEPGRGGDERSERPNGRDSGDEKALPLGTESGVIEEFFGVVKGDAAVAGSVLVSAGEGVA